MRSDIRAWRRNPQSQPTARIPSPPAPTSVSVHNGSLSNHNALRRELIRYGLSFQTENDTEVAAGYMSWRMREGDSLEQTLNSSLTALDGFYTFVVGTESGFGVLRDPIACKPAVMAETDRWVAFGTEYRALVDLPGIDAARVWEPRSREGVSVGAAADANVSISSQTSLRELNATLHRLRADTNETHWRVTQSARTARDRRRPRLRRSRSRSTDMSATTAPA